MVSDRDRAHCRVADEHDPKKYHETTYTDGVADIIQEHYRCRRCGHEWREYQ